MYFDDSFKFVAVLFVLTTIVLFSSPFLFANYDIVISPKPVEFLEQQDLLKRISSLESDNADLLEVIEAYPPEPVNYSSAIVFLGFCAVLISIVYLLYWSNLKEKELKILAESKEDSKKK